MSTPQDSPRRLKQKRRRTTQLEKWRAKQPVAAEAKGTAPEAKAAKKA